MAEVTINGIKVGTAERVFKAVPVTTMASGLEMTIPVHIINGAKPGPKLFLNANSHCDGDTGLEVIRQVLEKVNPEELSGTIIAIPCANPVGFEWYSRNTPVDANNMNRMFPGRMTGGWFTEQMACVVSSFCKEADALIDWHGGGYGLAINYVLINRAPGELGKQVREMGLAYGFEFMYDGKPAGPAAAYAGTLTDYMLSLGKPAIVAEVGTGMPVTFDMIAGSVQGVFNVMKHMGMLEGKPILPKTQYLCVERPLLRPSKGGMFYPMCGPEYLNKWVPKGTVIGIVRNPQTFEVLEEIVAPCDETVFLMMRGVMGKVHPGDYAYILANRANAEVIHND